MAAHATARDVQRAALRELVSLLTESATTESELEARHRAAGEEISKATERSRQEIDQRYAALREEVEQTYAARVTEVDSKFQEAVHALSASSDAIRRRINHDHDNVIAGVKKRFEQAAFMSESLLEATQNTIRDEAKKAKSRKEGA